VASLFKSITVAYRDADGRKARKGEPGAVVVRITSKNWYGRYRDADGRTRTVPLCRDKAASKSMLAKLESDAALRRSGLIDPRADTYKRHEAGSIAAHLADWEGTLRARGNTPKHSSVSAHRAARVLDTAGVRSLAEISLSRVQEAMGNLRGQGLGVETINHHVRAVKAFSRWLHRDGRTRDHALAYLAIGNPEVDRRRERRSLTYTEAARLIVAAEAGPTVKGIIGADRAMAYRLALGTGFRAAEITSLVPESFNLDMVPPVVTVRAGYSKNRREAVQPLPSELTELLRAWLAGKPPGLPVLPLPDRTAEMLRVDLTSAGIPYRDGSGRVLDFHALRHSFITHLVASGASVKVAQTLARHSTPSLTIGRYAHASLHDVAGALEGLPKLSNPGERESRKAKEGG
jgi:integrase/recombinase XerD